MPINEVAGSNVHRVQDFMGAKCILLKIRGCHGTYGTHANAPSATFLSLGPIKVTITVNPICFFLYVPFCQCPAKPGFRTHYYFLAHGGDRTGVSEEIQNRGCKMVKF